MGGNLFKLGRISRERYQQIYHKLKPYLNQKFGDLYRIPRFYGNKADFGDMDIILSTALVKDRWQHLQKEIKADLEITVAKSDGGTFSTVYENFQVDFFIRPEKYFLSSYNFLSFNDIGNLIGKICRRFNLKYGERGLAYVYRRADGHYAKDIPITLDFRQIYEFLQLDYAKWESGFASREEMFDWVIDSPYFSVQPYVKLSSSMEKRLRERSTIQRFLAYLEEKKVTKTYEYLANRDEYLPMIEAAFPAAQLSLRIKEEQEREAYLKVIKEKFNGKIIMQLRPELSGKELGVFINSLKAKLGDHEKFLYEASPEEITRLILTWQS